MCQYNGKVQTGDIVLVKKSGGPVVAVFVIGSISSHANLTPAKISSIRNQYSNNSGLSVDDDFWKEKAHSKYGTLINIKRFRKVSPYTIEKKTELDGLYYRKENSIKFLLGINENKQVYHNNR